jgi:hypothetical protein
MRTLILVLLISAFSMALSEGKTASAMSASGSSDAAFNKQCGIFDKGRTHSAKQLAIAREIMSRRHKEFFQCKSDSDCVITKGSCGELTSVVLEAKECFDKAVYEHGKTINCLELGGNQTAYPKCLNNMCTTRKK